MAHSPVTFGRSARLLTTLLLLLAATWVSAAPASAQAACSETFEVPIEEETGEDLEAAPGDEVIEIALGAQRARTVTLYADCGTKPGRANPNPGFGVFPGTASVPRRVFDRRRGQAGRDAEQLAGSRKKRAKRTAGRR